MSGARSCTSFTFKASVRACTHVCVDRKGERETVRQKKKETLTKGGREKIQRRSTHFLWNTTSFPLLFKDSQKHLRPLLPSQQIHWLQNIKRQLKNLNKTRLTNSLQFYVNLSPRPPQHELCEAKRERERAKEEADQCGIPGLCPPGLGIPPSTARSPLSLCVGWMPNIRPREGLRLLRDTQQIIPSFIQHTLPGSLPSVNLYPGCWGQRSDNLSPGPPI